MKTKSEGDGKCCFENFGDQELLSQRRAMSQSEATECGVPYTSNMFIRGFRSRGFLYSYLDLMICMEYD